MTPRDNVLNPSPAPAATEIPARTAPAAGDPFDAWARRATRWLAWLAVTGLVFYVCWLMLAPFFDVVLWAAALAIAFWPVHRRISARIRSPNAAAAISCSLVVVTILVPLTLVTLAVARDAARLAQIVQANKEHLFDRDAPTPLGRLLRHVDQYVDIDRVASGRYVAERMSEFSGAIARKTLNVVGGLAGAIVWAFLILFTTFFLFRDGGTLAANTRDLLPLDRWQADELVARMRDVVYASVYGGLVIAIVQGTLGGLAFWALGVPSALLWGVVMTILCMVPLAGAFLVWIPAAIYLVVVGQEWRAVAMAAWGTLVISMVDNILRPKLVGERTNMHALVVFFAVLGGLRVFGAIGLIAGPVVAAVAMALVDLWRRSNRNTRALPECRAASPTITPVP